MRKLLGAIATTTALALLGAPAASALPQEIGDRCTANADVANTTALVLNNALGYPELPPIVPPEGAKVITKWKVNAPPGIEPIAQQLVASKQVAEEDDQLVGASALETVVGGAANEFSTRIPVPEYAHIGLRGPSRTLFCDKTSGHLGGLIAGNWATGETRHFKVEFLGVPVLAWVEPDRDGDGFGDESQDGCPRSAAHSGPCPALALTPKAKVLEKSILVTVAASEAAEVKVWGQARWQARKPSGKVVKVTKQLSFGIKKTVNPGTPGQFRLPLGKPVLKRLGQIEPSQHLNAIVLANAYDLNGKPVLRKLELRLPGRG
jgi:hypothetical protein